MTGIGTSCGACKFLRRKCTSECVFAPYFCYDEASTHFAAVHKVFGASNVSKILSHLPLQSRSDAATTLSYEALARMGDPIYGCVAHIFALQQQIVHLQEEIELLGTHMANNFRHRVASSGSNITEANNYNQLAGSQLFSQNDGASNAQQHQKEQPHVVSNAENANINQAFDVSTSCSWEDQENMHFADYSLERLIEDIDQENFRHYPWLDLDEGTIGNL